MDLLSNTIQPYAWGSRTAIARLQGRPASDGPEAELWMGAHPKAPSRVIRAGAAERSLVDVVADDPEATVGSGVLDRFGARLPYLLKVLAAEQPLSLQVHPTPEQARAGFDAEERAGVPVGASERNYKDPYSKPELIAALTPFTGLCGFRDPRELAAVLTELDVPALKPLADALDTTPTEATVRSTLEALLRWPDEERAGLVGDVAASADRLRGTASRFAKEYDWVARIAEDYPGDTGVVVVLMLNLVELAPGEAMFLRPRTPHAYLRGVGVEIMAGSDNVLRGGLTPKHIDVDELLAVLDFSTGPLEPTPTTTVSEHEVAWVTPTPEFRLSRIDVRGDEAELSVGVPQILVCTDGEVTLDDGAERLPLAAGTSAFVPAATATLRVRGSGTVFRARPGE